MPTKWTRLSCLPCLPCLPLGAVVGGPALGMPWEANALGVGKVMGCIFAICFDNRGLLLLSKLIMRHINHVNIQFFYYNKYRL